MHSKNDTGKLKFCVFQEKRGKMVSAFILLDKVSLKNNFKNAIKINNKKKKTDLFFSEIFKF